MVYYCFLISNTMESNRDEASHCIELSKLYIKKKDLVKAWKFSVKAHKLFPTSKTKCLMKKLRSSLKSPTSKKRRTSKHTQTISSDSDTSYNGDESNSSTSNDTTPTHQPTKKTKKSSKSSTAYSFKMFKDINKDESYKCLEIADQHIQNKQFELAEKFVLKSKKLYLLSRADELLKNIQELKELNKPTYTEEQENFVKKVKNSENFYSMLGIKSNASVPEIKKAYKKLALLLHPDKNTAPGSGEVFTVVSNAVSTLCDDTKRRAYDQTLWKPHTSAFNFSTHNSTHNYYRQQSSRTSFGTHRNPFRFYQNSYDESDGDDVYCDDEEEEEVDDYDYCTDNEHVNSYDYYGSYEY